MGDCWEERWDKEGEERRERYSWAVYTIKDESFSSDRERERGKERRKRKNEEKNERFRLIHLHLLVLPQLPRSQLSSSWSSVLVVRSTCGICESLGIIQYRVLCEVGIESKSRLTFPSWRLNSLRSLRAVRQAKSQIRFTLHMIKTLGKRTSNLAFLFSSSNISFLLLSFLIPSDNSLNTSSLLTLAVLPLLSFLFLPLTSWIWEFKPEMGGTRRFARGSGEALRFGSWWRARGVEEEFDAWGRTGGEELEIGEGSFEERGGTGFLLEEEGEDELPCPCPVLVVEIVLFPVYKSVCIFESPSRGISISSLTLSPAPPPLDNLSTSSKASCAPWLCSLSFSLRAKNFIPLFTPNALFKSPSPFPHLSISSWPNHSWPPLDGSDSFEVGWEDLSPCKRGRDEDGCCCCWLGEVEEENEEERFKKVGIEGILRVWGSNADKSYVWDGGEEEEGVWKELEELGEVDLWVSNCGERISSSWVEVVEVGEWDWDWSCSIQNQQSGKREREREERNPFCLANLWVTRQTKG